MPPRPAVRARALARAALVRGAWGVRHRLRRALLADDWSFAPPDFIGIGTAHAGTTWWYGLIAQHPRVQRLLCSPKEIDFFRGYWQRELSPSDVRRYHRLFPRPPGQIVGEWTPRYLFDPWTPPLLDQVAPHAKLLVMLRDPVERYRTTVTVKARRLGFQSSHRLAEEAFERGLYGAQLERLSRGQRERLLVLQYERCVAEPASELSRTYSFLGINAGFVPSGLTRRVNRTPWEKAPLPPHVEASLAAAYRADVARLAELAPQIDLRLWPSVAPR